MTVYHIDAVCPLPNPTSVERLLADERALDPILDANPTHQIVDFQDLGYLPGGWTTRWWLSDGPADPVHGPLIAFALEAFSPKSRKARRAVAEQRRRDAES